MPVEVNSGVQLPDWMGRAALRAVIRRGPAYDGRMTPAFQRALARVLRYEGGYVDHPSDPGGATNRGITQAAYDRWRSSQNQPLRSVRDCTLDETTAIYWRDYWLPSGAEQKPAPMAAATFDAAVHSGISNALKFEAGAAGDWQEAINLREEFIIDLATWPVFSRGWAKRLTQLRREIARDEVPQTITTRAVIMYDQTGRIVGRVPLEQDLLIRVTPTAAHVRPDPLEVPE